MKRDVNKINDKLREYQKKWYNSICIPWINKGGAREEDTKNFFKNKYESINYGFSEPFFTGVCKFKNDYPLIMFVGQETNGWGDYNDYFKPKKFELDVLIRESQNYVHQFTINNFTEKKDKIKYHEKNLSGYSSYAFWNFIRLVYAKTNKKINVVWNELDKIHYRCENSDCETLWVEDEKELNKPLINNRSLLHNEICTIIKPDMVVFLTGPNYYNSMKSALLVEKLCKPTKSDNLKFFNIEDIPCCWTYHPNALNRFGNFDEVAEKIAEKIGLLHQM